LQLTQGNAKKLGLAIGLGLGLGQGSPLGLGYSVLGFRVLVSIIPNHCLHATLAYSMRKQPQGLLN